MTIPKEIREKIEQKLKFDKEIEDWIKVKRRLTLITG